MTKIEMNEGSGIGDVAVAGVVVGVVAGCGYIGVKAAEGLLDAGAKAIDWFRGEEALAASAAEKVIAFENFHSRVEILVAAKKAAKAAALAAPAKAA